MLIFKHNKPILSERICKRILVSQYSVKELNATTIDKDV